MAYKTGYAKAAGRGSSVAASLFGLKRCPAKRVTPGMPRLSEDKTTQELAFTLAIIGLAARLAKADGPVTPEEYLAFRALFPAQGDIDAAARALFGRACSEEIRVEYYAQSIIHYFAGKRRLLEEVLERLFRIATSDGPLTSEEQAILQRIARTLGFGRWQFRKMVRQHAISGEDPYHTLHMSAKATNEQIKQAYRRLIREYHPDGLQAYGFSAAEVAAAQRRLAAINGAYDTIRRERGMR